MCWPPSPHPGQSIRQIGRPGREVATEGDVVEDVAPDHGDAPNHPAGGLGCTLGNPHTLVNLHSWAAQAAALLQPFQGSETFLKALGEIDLVLAQRPGLDGPAHPGRAGWEEG